MSKKYVAILLMLVFTGMGSHCFGESFKVITNKSMETTTLSKVDFYKIMRGTKLYWEDGSPVKIAYIYNKKKEMMKDETVFLEKHARVNMFQLERLWNKLKFSGNATAPFIYNDPQQVVEFVSENQGSIGLVPKNTALKDTTTITIK